MKWIAGQVRLARAQMIALGFELADVVALAAFGAVRAA